MVIIEARTSGILSRIFQVQHAILVNTKAKSLSLECPALVVANDDYECVLSGFTGPIDEFKYTLDAAVIDTPLLPSKCSSLKTPMQAVWVNSRSYTRQKWSTCSGLMKTCRIEQCFAVHIVQCCQQYCSALLHPIQAQQHCSILLTTMNNALHPVFINPEQVDNFLPCSALQASG